MNFIDLKVQYNQIKQEIDSAIKNVVESTQFILGPDVSELEKEIGQYCKTKYAIGVASGTDALLLPLMAIGLTSGDEVITTPFTFIATAEVIAFLGAKPVFVDIDYDTMNIDSSKIEKAITKKTKAIIPVHLYGQCADMDPILEIAKKNNLFVLEDAAQAFGAEYKNKKAGTIGNAGAFSFFPSKNLGCYGDGGMIITNDEKLADKIAMLRVHGSKKRYEHKYIGINGRLDTIQAAILRVKLRHFENWIKLRKEKFDYYSEKLKDIVLVPEEKEYNKYVCHQYTIRTSKRDELSKYLNDLSIPTAIYYPKPLHLQEAFAYLGYKNGDFPVSERCAREVLSLPFFPEITYEQQDIIIKSIKEFFKK